MLKLSKPFVAVLTNTQKTLLNLRISVIPFSAAVSY